MQRYLSLQETYKALFALLNSYFGESSLWGNYLFGDTGVNAKAKVKSKFPTNRKHLVSDVSNFNLVQIMGSFSSMSPIQTKVRINKTIESQDGSNTLLDNQYLYKDNVGIKRHAK